MDTELPRHISPKERSPEVYAQSIKQYDIAIARTINNVLKKDMDPKAESATAFLTTGSDARLEKAPLSPIEIIALTDSSPNSRPLAQSAAKLLYARPPVEIYSMIDIRELERDSMTFYLNDRRRAFPSRFTDSRFIYGNNELYKLALSMLYEELTGEDGKHIKEQVRQRRKMFRNISTTGKQRFKGDEIVHFDLDTDIAYYTPDKHVASFKYGPLRLLQETLTLELMQYMAEKKSPGILFEFPANTEDKLYYLETNGLTHKSHSEIADLATSYKYFLWLYHMTQQEFSEQGEAFKGYRFDKKEVRERLKSIDTLTKDPIF